MPLLAVSLSHELFESVREKTLHELSSTVASVLDKPEAAVCVTLRQSHFLFGGETGPAAFVEVRTKDALDSRTTGVLCTELCKILADEADVPSERVFLNFLHVKATNWGWKGKTLR